MTNHSREIVDNCVVCKRPIIRMKGKTETVVSDENGNQCIIHSKCWNKLKTRNKSKDTTVKYETPTVFSPLLGKLTYEKKF